MYYEINVSLHGMHFFATAERSLKTASVCKAVYKEFVKAFSKSKGYELSITCVQTHNVMLNIEDLK